MIFKPRRARAFATLVIGVGLFAGLATTNAGAASYPPVTYSSIPSPLPGNVSSTGFEAASASELGNVVQLVQPGRLSKARVVMSSWACQNGSWFAHDCVTTGGATFTHSLTFNVYAVSNPGPNPSVGALLGSRTINATLPYRPSADNTNCTGGNAGKWFNVADSTCY